MTNLLSQHDCVLIAAAIAVLAAARYDVREFRIPNECSLLLLALYPLHLWLSPAAISIDMSILVAAAVFAGAFLIHFLGRFGGGDVKLLSVLALWAGPALAVDFLMVTALAGGVMAIVYMSRFRMTLACAFDAVGDTRTRDTILTEQLPYGLAIAAGGVAVLIRLSA
ncbi:MAG: prepilin peptidase [Rhodospirillales bacterium]|nr:prepilin peptidase [Rhodospirillales bacterium]MBO6788739.1 prepilin peptidase [Rhodospirillales bacterium]